MTDKTSDKSRAALPFAEFVALMALLMAVTALSTDAILPAFNQMGDEFDIHDAQRLQLIISMIFAGLSIGQLIAGPLSDSKGRKFSICLGLIIFVIGDLISMFSTSFGVMLFGRFLQGLGASGPRAVILALVRDVFNGREMARLMSFVVGIFIFVPALAPTIGQGVINVGGWRAIFLLFLLLAAIGFFWFYIRQPETLPLERRIPLTFDNFWRGTKIVFSTPTCLGYMLIAGFVFGPFVTYLGIAQDLFQNTYGLGELFSLVFAVMALSNGIGSVTSARFVVRFGMRFFVRVALTGMLIISILALIVAVQYDFRPPLYMVFIIFSPMFFCFGILFGNVNTMAMEDVGQIAGLASAWVSALSTIMGTILATILGLLYNGSIFALTLGFGLAGFIGLVIMAITEHYRLKADAQLAE